MNTGPHSPAARRKAAATYKRRRAERKAALAAAQAGGTTTTIDVASLPARPVKTKGVKRPHRPPEERLQIVEEIRAALARGERLRLACNRSGISDNSYYSWSRHLARDKRKVVAASSSHLKVNGHAGPVQVTLQVTGIALSVAGHPLTLSLADAIRLQQGLDRLLQGSGIPGASR